jgi:hypothetical protein
MGTKDGRLRFSTGADEGRVAEALFRAMPPAHRSFWSSGRGSYLASGPPAALTRLRARLSALFPDVTFGQR